MVYSCHWTLHIRAFICACLYSAYSWRCMWCVHFLPPDRCSPASSSLDRVSPKFPLQGMMMQRCCHSNAPLHRKPKKRLIYYICYLSQGTVISELKLQHPNPPRCFHEEQTMWQSLTVVGDWQRREACSFAHIPCLHRPLLNSYNQYETQSYFWEVTLL